MLNFDFLEKGQEIVSPPNFVYDFSRKIFLMLHCGNLFPANVPILYPLETPENQRFSGVFRGYKMGTLAGNGLTDEVSLPRCLIAFTS